MEPTYFRHEHTGTDSAKIFGGNLINAPQSALTVVNSGILSTGGGATLQTSDQLIIDNMRTRINNLETKLIELGFILHI